MSDQTVDSILAELRAGGWSVAVHNDYRVSAEHYTSWLLTHANGRWVKGEGRDDVQALTSCLNQIKRYSMGGDLVGPYAVAIKDNGANASVNLAFDDYEQAQKFWRWCDMEIANHARRRS